MKLIKPLLLTAALVIAAGCSSTRPAKPPRYSVWWKAGATPEDAQIAVARAKMESERVGMVDMSPAAFWFREAQKGNMFKAALNAQGYKARTITTNDHPRAAEFPRR